MEDVNAALANVGLDARVDDAEVLSFGLGCHLDNAVCSS